MWTEHRRDSSGLWHRWTVSSPVPMLVWADGASGSWWRYVDAKLIFQVLLLLLLLVFIM